MSRSFKWSILTAFGLSVLVVSARGDEEKLPLDKLPAAVKKAVNAKFPNAKHKEASKETEDGKTLYEVSLTHDGHDYDVTLTEAGAFAEIEKTIKAAELPGPVAHAVKAKYPKSTIAKAEHVTKDAEAYFEVHLKDGDKSREVVLDPAGKILKEEEGDEG